MNAFQNSLGKSTDPDFQSKAWYNIGNAQLKAGDYKSAVEAYKTL
ncbi:MAG: tetratricopeptide repeat protein [Ignavibacteriales bacterium]|nr:tetratricopeptide repeat protein [Ignavibacteriales bacterium]